MINCLHVPSNPSQVQLDRARLFLWLEARSGPMVEDVKSHLLSIPSLLQGWAERTPDGEMLAAPGALPLTYGRLASHTERRLDELVDLGIRRGDRLAIVLPQGPRMMTTFLVVAARGVAAPLNPSLDESALAWSLPRSGHGRSFLSVGWTRRREERRNGSPCPSSSSCPPQTAWQVNSRSRAPNFGGP